MLTMMLLAHLLGDYVLQFDALVRWKLRSIWGVVAHGGIVTLMAVVCAMLLDPGWWPYALLIGVIHTGVDVIRARLLHPKSTSVDLILFVFDQLVHVTVVVFVVGWSGYATLQPPQVVAIHIDAPKVLAAVTGYLLLLQPAWVLLRFVVRGVWGPDSAPHLGNGEKYGPMVERALIATLVIAGQFALIPLVLLPRRMTSIRWQSNGVGVMVQLTTHWAETLLGVLLAAGVGLILRMVVFS